MTCNDIRVALSAVKLRSGAPMEISDSDGRTVRVMHLDGDRFELTTRGGGSRIHSLEEAVDLLCWLQGKLSISELDAARYAVGAA